MIDKQDVPVAHLQEIRLAETITNCFHRKKKTGTKLDYKVIGRIEKFEWNKGMMKWQRKKMTWILVPDGVMNVMTIKIVGESPGNFPRKSFD